MSDSYSELPEWTWRVIVYTEERGKLILSAHEPHRGDAKRYVSDRLEAEIERWGDTYIPRPSWDCPVCGVHEGLTKQPNLRGSHDWECMSCLSRLWGEPMEWDRIEEGSQVPEYRRNTTQQAKLGETQ